MNPHPSHNPAVIVNPQACIRCGACIRDCVVEVLRPDADGLPSVRPELERFCLNCQHCLAVCPAGAITCHGVSSEQCAPVGTLPAPETMMNLIRQRRSIRQYSSTPVPHNILDKLAAVLAWTPTGCNVHSLVFRIVSSPEEMDVFRAETARLLKWLIRTGIMPLIYPNFRRYMDEIMNGKDVIFRNAPHMVVAAVPKNAPCAEADPWIALSYFDLYAQTLGIGTCWCGFGLHAIKWNSRLKKRLMLPRGYKIGAVLLFGYPDVAYCRATAPENFPVGFLNDFRNGQ